MRDERRRLPVELSRDHDLLLVAAGQPRGRRLRPKARGCRSRASARSPCVAARRTRETRPTRKAVGALSRSIRFSATDMDFDQRRRAAVGGHVGEARRRCVRRRRRARVRGHRARSSRRASWPQARKGLDEFQSDRCRRRRRRRGLRPPRTSNDKRAQTRTGEAIDREPYRALPGRTRRVRRRDVAPDHHRREFGPA